jgi:hypothetical protein
MRDASFICYGDASTPRFAAAGGATLGRVTSMNSGRLTAFVGGRDVEHG